MAGSSKKKAYCGIGPATKNRKLGTLKECAKQKQIRRYGMYKVDSRMLKQMANPKKNDDKIKRKNAIMRMVMLRGRVGKLAKDLTGEKDAKKKDAIKKALETARKELVIVSKEYAQIDQRMHKKGGSAKAKGPGGSGKKDVGVKYERSKKGSRKTRRRASKASR